MTMFLPDCEPFVLQVTMGMSEKMLALFEILARADEDITSKVINQVFQWLLLICSGKYLANIIIYSGAWLQKKKQI